MLRPLRPLFIAVLGLAICAAGLQAKAAKKDKKDPKEVKGHEAEITSINYTKKTLTVTIDGKKRTVTITDGTKFIGPRGGVSDDGLKDDRIKRGTKVKIVFNPGGKSAKEIHLKVRKNTKKKDKRK